MWETSFSRLPCCYFAVGAAVADGLVAVDDGADQVGLLTDGRAELRPQVRWHPEARRAGILVAGYVHELLCGHGETSEIAERARDETTAQNPRWRLRRIEHTGLARRDAFLGHTE